MQIMRYRAALINAALGISPGAAGGTTVTCAFVHVDQFARAEQQT